MEKESNGSRWEGGQICLGKKECCVLPATMFKKSHIHPIVCFLVARTLSMSKVGIVHHSDAFEHFWIHFQFDCLNRVDRGQTVHGPYPKLSSATSFLCIHAMHPVCWALFFPSLVGFSNASTIHIAQWHNCTVALTGQTNAPRPPSPWRPTPSACSLIRVNSTRKLPML